MRRNPSVWGRMVSRFRGEVPAESLEAYRYAGRLVGELMEQVRARRLACAVEGLDAWSVPPATRAGFLCAWNAFVLQALGDALLDADYAANLATAGYVPRGTHDEAAAYYGQVQVWLDRALQALASPDFRLDADVPATLPVPVPVQAEPFTGLLARAGRQDALLAVLRRVEEETQGMMMLVDAPAGDAWRAGEDRIRQLHASAQAGARHALDQYRAGRLRDVRDRVERYAREAVGMYYELGQRIADPPLAVQDAQPPAAALVPVVPVVPAAAIVPAATIVPAAAVAPPPKPVVLVPANVAPPPQPGPARPDARCGLPHLRGINVWCLTHPAARRELGADSRALAALKRLWARDPDPRRTLRLHRAILDAMERGAVAYAEDERGGTGYFHQRPWGPVYAARQAVTLDSQRIRKGEQFILDVRAGQSGSFTRCLLVSRFERTRTLHEDKPFGARYVGPYVDV